MNGGVAEYYKNVEKCVDDLIEKVGKKIVLAIPLALGKPNQLVNALYQRIKEDQSLHLTIITAVSLEKPSWSNDLERRFVEPMVKRVWEDFPDFEYLKDLRSNTIPPNFELVEFYNKTAAFVGVPHAQQHYLGSNYTHAIRDAVINKCNVMAQMVSQREIDGKKMYSMSCNPDTNLDAARLLREFEAKGKKVAIIAQLNNNLPFMYGKAVVEPDLFHMVIDNPEYDFKLFGAPKMSVSPADWMIGLHASTLIKDGGTLQVGIGSLGDAVVSGILMRHKDNKNYQKFVKESGIFEKHKELIGETGGLDTFEKGILGSSEMFVDSMIELIKNGVMKRKVYEHVGLQKLINEGEIHETVTSGTLKSLIDKKVVNQKLTLEDFEFLNDYGIFKEGLELKDDMILDGTNSYSCDLTDVNNLNNVLNNCLGTSLKKGVIMYGSFFLGPQDFYTELRNLPEEESKLIDMRSVDYVNHLYGDQEIKVLQRQYGRFVNAALMVTLAGAVVADALDNGRIISGPGGQYNFVSMAHELPKARAITMIRSTRGAGKNLVSNIVWQYGHATIPRHLRDVIITEYGIADLRGGRDKDVIASLINIADSRFQEELLATAKKAKKIPEDYQIPEEYKNNYPETNAKKMAPFVEKGLFKPFPFGTDLTSEEIVIGKALKGFKAKAADSIPKLVPGLLKEMVSSVPEDAQLYLKRMQLDSPASMKEKVMQKVVVYALKASGGIN